MKLTLAAMLALLLTLIGTPSYAQGAQKVGVSGGVALTKIVASACQTYAEPCDLDFQTGLTVGVFAPLEWGNGKYAIQPELRFSMRGGKSVDEGLRGVAANEGIKSNYLEFPVLGRVNISYRNINSFVVLGPSFGLRLSAEDSEGNDFKDSLNAFDFEVVLGGGVQINDRIAVEARYQQSVFDVFPRSYGAEVELDEQRFNRYNNRAISFLVDVTLRK